MSGPSTRSHRSSVRGMETTLAEVSALLRANKSVVMITGAGLSAASGIPTFRGGNDSVWSVTAASLGRRSVFLRDPLRWYNEFFLRHFPMSFTQKTPNPGHEAIAALARAFPELRVITQNIDGLHRDTINVWPDPQRLIEAHGRLGLFKCVSDNGRGEEKEDEEDGEGEGGDECPYSYEKEIRPSAFSESVCATLEDDGCAAAARGLTRSLTEVPRCPHCGKAAPPMSLLFDEDYDSHSFYDFDRIEEWFKGADALVFVGTSFAVTLTSLAIREAKRRKIPVFDFNLSVGLKASPALNAKTVIGPAEAMLPTLAALAGVTLATSPSPAATAAAAAAAAAEVPVAATTTAEAAAAATASDNPNHNHNAIHSCSNRASGGGGGRDGSNCSSTSTDSSINGCSSSNNSSSGCTSSDCNGSNIGSSSNSSRSSIDSSSSSSSSSNSSGSSSGSVNNSVSTTTTTTAINGNAPTGGNDEEGTGHGSPTGRRTREDSPGTEGDKKCQLEESRPAKKARTSNSGGEGPGAAAGPAMAVAAAAAAAAAVAAAAAAANLWGGGAPFLLEPALEMPLRKDQVRVELSEAYSRKPHPDREVEANVETLWQEQLAKNPLLFNGSKFRLAGFSTEGGRATSPPPPAAAPASASDAMDVSEGGGRKGDAATASTTSSSPSLSPPLPPPQSRSPSSPPTRKLHLRLGLTDYKTFRGTNWSPAAARLAADSARDHPWLEGAYLSQKLGVGAVVETSDGHVVSLRRSNGVAEGQGMMDAPGGHPEPEKLGLTAQALKGLSRKSKSSRRKVAQQATDELFDSAVQEVVDETNLPRSALGKPLLSGLVRQGNSFGAPSAAFIIPCSLDCAEVSALYAHGAKEAFESTELRLIPGAEIVAEGGSAWFAARGLQASPSFLGALELWRAHRFRSSS